MDDNQQYGTQPYGSPQTVYSPQPQAAPTMPATPGALPPNTVYPQPVPGGDPDDDVPRKLSASAVAGLVLGIIGIIFSFIPIINNVAFIIGIIGLVFGIIGLVATKRGGKRRGRGLAIAAVILTVLAMVITLVMQQATGKALDDALGTSSTTSQSASSGAKKDSGNSSSSAAASGAQDTEGDLGKLHVKIVSAAKSGADYNGQPTVLVTYEWTNNTDKNQVFSVATSAKAFQNGKELDMAIYTEAPAGYDSNASLQEIQPGATQQVSVGYVLQDDSPVDVEVSGTLDFSGAKVSHTYQLQ
jgi:hypothetical protein